MSERNQRFRRMRAGTSFRDMSFDPNVLMASLAVSGVGWVLFSYGRKQHRFPQTAIGLVMLVYPYFVSNIAWMLGLVPVFLTLLWLLTRLGL